MMPADCATDEALFSVGANDTSIELFVGYRYLFTCRKIRHSLSMVQSSCVPLKELIFGEIFKE